MAAPRLEERARSHRARFPVRAAHVRDRRAQLAVDGDQGHADRVVFVQALVVRAGDDAVHAVADEQGQVFALAGGPSHRVADQDAVAGVGQGVFDLDGEFSEEGEGHGGNDQSNGLGALAVEGARQRVGAVSQGFDGVCHGALGFF